MGNSIATDPLLVWLLRNRLYFITQYPNNQKHNKLLSVKNLLSLADSNLGNYADELNHDGCTSIPHFWVLGNWNNKAFKVLSAFSKRQRMDCQ